MSSPVPDRPTNPRSGMTIHPDGMIWRCGARTLPLAGRPLVMGVLNVTPDSFSDGGQSFTQESAIARGQAMIRQGADLIDVGGESSRPGAAPVDAAEERRRVLPVVEALCSAGGAVISLDTTKAAVARDALTAGVQVINDISAGLLDPSLPGLALEAGAGYILMHMRGTPRTMQQAPVYGDVVTEVRSFLEQRMAHFEQMGFSREQLVLDPGFGFGKTDEHNLALLRGLGTLASLGAPVLAGVSRKSFIGRILGREVSHRQAGSLAAAMFAVERGARILRVHDVLETCDALRMMRILRKSAIEPWSATDGTAASTT